MRLAAVLSALVLTLGCKSREEKLKEAEDKGNLLAATKAKMVKGVGEALKNEGKEAAETVSEGTGEVVKAVGKGFDTSLSAVKVEVAPALAEKGVGVTRASRMTGEKEKHGISVYVVLDTPYEGTLEARAYGEKHQEVGRVSIQVAEKQPIAKYFDFEFDSRTPLNTVDHFELR